MVATKHVFLADEGMDLPLTGNGVEQLRSQRGFVVQ